MCVESQAKPPSPVVAATVGAAAAAAAAAASPSAKTSCCRNSSRDAQCSYAPRNLPVRSGNVSCLDYCFPNR